MNSLQDQHVLILGLGASGLAMARWCARCGAQVTVADTRTAPPQLAALQRDVPTARFVGGPFEAALIDGADVRAVFKSPGLAPDEIAVITLAAHPLGIRMAGELGLFQAALADLKVTRDYQPKVLAITGTNGKTTVTSLTGQLVSRTGKTVALAGNTEYARHRQASDAGCEFLRRLRCACAGSRRPPKRAPARPCH